mmetsp:Transcript_89527/g.256396  ORF Transcript_89527/g.256396 Transcript_89527/m.256396 type:complete len:212 (-) Transcript_89527:566-1201(-)
MNNTGQQKQPILNCRTKLRWCRRVSQTLFSKVDELLLHHRTFLAFHLLAIFAEQDDRGECANTKPGGPLRLLVRINLGDTTLRSQLPRSGLQMRGHHLARSTPSGIHIQEQRRRAVLELLVELGARQHDDGAGDDAAGPAEIGLRDLLIEKHPQEPFHQLILLQCISPWHTSGAKLCPQLLDFHRPTPLEELHAQAPVVAFGGGSRSACSG